MPDITRKLIVRKAKNMKEDTIRYMRESKFMYMNDPMKIFLHLWLPSIRISKGEN